MLTDEQIANNKDEFLRLISQINIEGADTQGLVDFLDGSDFFSAPASTMYHENFKGGLCDHSLHVYHNLEILYNQYKDILPKEYSKDTLIVVGLLHDISKTNTYEEYVMNKKVYTKQGLKHDNMGNFDWFAESAYKLKDVHDRFVVGTHEETSMILISKYIPLSLEETIAVMHHQAVPSEGQVLRDMSAILNRYPLVTLLQMADYISTFINERV